MSSIADGRYDLIALRNHFCGRGSNLCNIEHAQDLLVMVTAILAGSSSSAVDAGNSFLV
jgi:hypothetical protein